MNAPFPNPPAPATRQPVLNLPIAVSGLIAFLVAIHAGRTMLLSPAADMRIVLEFAFIPIRIVEPELFVGFAMSGARVWSFLTYAFLHADWSHVLINAVWLAAFGSPLARRFGTTRFLLFSAVGAVAGAALHFAIDPNSQIPLVGASAAISAQMAGAARFVFQQGGPMWRHAGADAYRRPAAPLREIIRDSRVLMFLGVWFGVNLIFGLVGGGLSEGAVAWDAHIGGFLAGLLLFRYFDPVRAPTFG